MALSGIGKNYNPSTLNTWLKGHGGYTTNGEKFFEGSVTPLGLKCAAKISNRNIASSLAAGNVVILNVLNGDHWVLATSMDGDSINVNDPAYSTTSYKLSDVMPGASLLFTVTAKNGLADVAHQLMSALAKA